MAGSDPISYHVADTFMLRAPLLPLQALREISSENLDSALKNYYSDHVVQEAIFLASPHLHNLCLKWLKGNLDESKSLDKLRVTLLKYLIRMASRCTPFGLFAGICSGEFSHVDEVNLSDKRDHQIFARPDMHYLCNLSSEILQDKRIRSKLNYFANSTLYPLGDGYRYIEYHTDAEGSRKYQLQQVYRSNELDKVLDFVSGGSCFSNLVNHITDEEISRHEALDFINQLIDNQVIVSDIEPVVSGEPYLDILHSKVDEPKLNNPSLNEIKNLKQLFHQINKADSAERIRLYKKLIGTAKEKHPDIPENLLIQADMKLNTSSVKLKAEIKDQLLDVVNVLMKLANDTGEGYLSNFRKAFVNRYGHAEVPLMTALDPEAGPGYLPGDKLAHASELIEEMRYTPNQNTYNEMTWSDRETMMMRKLHHALIVGSDHIEISLEDFDDRGKKGSELPASFSMIARCCGKIVDDDHHHLVQLVASGGSSALNLSGRFSHMDNKLHSCMRQLSEREQSVSEDSILAEIVHLPEQRTGNILMRPVLRNFEIPYLASPGVDHKHKILVADLLLSVRNDRFRIRSQRLDKFIIPRMANAHNYSMGALPVYRFLCDMQSQQMISGIGFSWGVLGNIIPYLPRVTYRNFILQAATWNLRKNDLTGLLEAVSDDELLAEMIALREKFRIPSRVLLQEGDNELWLNFENIRFIKLFRNEIQNCTQVVLQESIIESNSSPVKGHEGSYANEFVFYFYQYN